MIKINVITNNTNWFKHIKKPNNYIDFRVNKLNLKIKNKLFFFCTLLLSDKKEIKILNKKFRKKNKATDVLSFPFYSKKDFKKRLRNDKEIYLGDVIINIDEIKNRKNSKEFKIEFNRLWIHGLVHLLGYDHKKNKDFFKMDLVEKNYLDIINDY